MSPPVRATYRWAVHGHIIDGERWIAARLAFLRERLEGELTPEERRATETEIEVLTKERGVGPSGLRQGRIARRLRRRT